MSPASSDLVFPPFRLDRRNQCVWRGSRLVPLPPKAFAVLCALAEQPGMLMTKDALISAVWPDVAVGDAVLKVCVAEIRKALGDDVRSPRFVATIHRRGYRFVAKPQQVNRHVQHPSNGVADDRHAGNSLPPEAAPGVRPPAPLVGRGPALARLDQWLGDARRGARQIVLVAGEPGIGKTALVDAFVARATASGPLLTATARCVEHYGPGEPYLPVLEALGRLCREPGGKKIVGVLRRHAPTWLAQMPWLLDEGELEDWNRELLGATRERMLREISEAVEALTADEPFVLVLEDLHWSDYGTIDVISALGTRREPARLLLVGTYRPADVAESDHPLRTVKQELAMHGRCQELPLGLLAEEDVRAFLKIRLPASRVDEQLAPLLHQRTEGNPLFVVNTVEDLVARRLVQRIRGAWRLAAPLGDLAVGVPSSLRDMVEGQLERVDAEVLQALEAASAAGIECSAAAIAAGLARPVVAVEQLLAPLVRRGHLLRAAGTDEWPDGTIAARYAFVHAVYAEVLYERISPARRCDLHLRIGDRAEQGYGDRAGEMASELARHFGLGRDDVRAVRYLCRAAESATRRFANREAVAHLTRALQATERLPGASRTTVEMMVMEALGMARRRMGDMANAARDFGALAERAGRAGDRAAEARALLHRASSLLWIDRDQGLAAAEASVARAELAGSEVLRAHARGYLGFQRILANGWTDADADACATAVEAARATGQPHLLSMHLGQFAYIQCHRSEYRVAVRTAEEALDHAVVLGDAYHYVSWQFHRAWALLHLARWSETRQLADDAFQRARRNEHALWARAFRFLAAWVHAEARDFAGARAMCEEALASASGTRLGQYLGLVVLGHACLGAGRRQQAFECFDEIARHRDADRPLMDWIVGMPLGLGLAEYWLGEGQHARARSEAERVSALAARSGERTYLALGERWRSEAALACGDPRAAADASSRSLAALDGGDVPLAEWRVHETAARVYRALDDPRRAAQARARAAGSLERLVASIGEAPDLRRAFLADPSVRAVLEAGSPAQRLLVETQPAPTRS